jgi:YVTN family beta-propeller protein
LVLAAAVDFRILGPLQVEDDGRPVALGGPKQRALLALLVLHANKVASRERLIDDLWGDRAPETAATALQGYVSALRKTVGPERILTRAPGYMLQVDPEAVDLGRFERLVREGRAAAADGNSEEASQRLSEALALWRGPPLADVNSTPFTYAEALRLEELRLAALEERLDVELALGRHADVIAELETLVAQHPLRERLRGQLMLALYRCGRQAEALQVYQEARRLLVGELGIEPGSTLRGLEQGILNQDPALEAPPMGTARAKATPRRGRRGVAVLGVILLAVATAAVAAIFLSRREPAPVVVPNSLAKIDPRTNEVVDVIGVGRFPGKVASGDGFVWVVNIEDETLTRVAPDSGRADLVAGLRLRSPAGLTVDGGRGVQVGSFEASEVVRVDPESLEVLEAIKLPGTTATFLAAGAGSLWITQPSPGFAGAVSSSVLRISLLNNRIERRFTSPVGVLPGQIAFGEGAAWVANVGDGTVWRIDAATNRIKRIRVGSQPTDVAVGFGSVWVPCLGRSSVWRLDATTGKVEAIIPTGQESLALAAGADAVWVTNQAAGTVSRIDPRTNRVVKTIELGFNPHGVVVADGGVWVAIAQGLI